MELTFKEFAQANGDRMRQWHEGDGEPWTGADWGNAAAGEMGEACNVVKKLRRIETGVALGRDDPARDELRRMLADELADTIAYLDLLAQHYGINLGVAVADKFNRVSDREGFPQKVSRSCKEPVWNDSMTLGRLAAWVIEHQDVNTYPSGMMPGDVLHEIRRWFGPDVLPSISTLDIRNAMSKHIGAPNPR